MTSILTNVAAMAALQTLRGIDDKMETTQARVSSGLRVGGAADNAAYWSIATTMRSDNMALAAVSDALGLGAAKVDTAYAAMESAVNVVKEIKAKLVAASEEGVDKTKIQQEIKQLQDQLKSISEAASFSGENWLQVDLGANAATEITKSVVGSFVRDSDGNVSVKKVSYTLGTNTVLFDEGADPATGFGAGILDKSHNINGNGVTLTVNVDGTSQNYNIVKYTTEEVIGYGGTFDSGGEVAVGGSGAAAYVKVGDDTWVAAVDQSSVTQQEVAVVGDDAVTAWAVDLTQLATADMEASVAGFKIDRNTTPDQIAGLVSMIDKTLEAIISASADLGSIAMRINLQEEFVTALSDSIDSGIGRLVDADMNEESTRLKALQTQQQLAIQSLSIANTASENILTLFRQ
ncbi:flagellin [Pseudorhizobium flavum]|uniref:flagellin N-terminal helical domain-containing protein n=1 Tax=Pseudorhizobium flavum TaxID=1335061 RepID=UPI0024935793|nr:flagellin [Pseudorhizobium flavum]